MADPLSLFHVVLAILVWSDNFESFGALYRFFSYDEYYDYYDLWMLLGAFL